MLNARTGALNEFLSDQGRPQGSLSCLSPHWYNKTGQTWQTLHTTLSVSLATKKKHPPDKFGLRKTFTIKYCNDKVDSLPILYGCENLSGVPSHHLAVVSSQSEERLTRVSWWITILNSNSRSDTGPVLCLTERPITQWLSEDPHQVCLTNCFASVWRPCQFISIATTNLNGLIGQR